jgi:malonyl-CoA/methylmalonyl-CoA synthetase
MGNEMSPIDPIAWIEAVIEEAPDRRFLATDDGRTLNYGALGAEIARLAATLEALGVRPGDRVAAQVEKSVEALLLYLACLWTGAIFMPLNTGYTEAEIDYFLGDAEPALLVVDPARAGLRDRLGGSIRLETLDARGAGTLTDAARSTDALMPRRRFAGDVPAAMLYTSGTTGKPKGAVLSRSALASNAVTLVDAWRFTRDDVLLHALPTFHVHGLFIATNTILAAGASMLFVPKFDASQVLRLLPGVTTFMGVPTYYTRLLSLPELDREGTASMRLFVSGSAPLLAETHRAFEERTGHAILERYGMTETLMNSSNPYDGPRVPGTVGPPLSGIEIRITDTETRKSLDGESIGMIEVRGPNLFQGYWRNPEKTAQDMRADGFFITGDIGKIDAAGYVHIVGRGKDLIISGGYNIYPKEVETEIDSLPGVVESAVIGVPHPDFGEGVVAIVVAEPGTGVDQANVLAGLQDRLARFKQPKAVFVVDELPRNTMGKVQKNLLRDAYAGIFTDA